MSKPIIMRLMSLSINIAKKAGGIIRDIMQKGQLGIIDKGHNDFQTEADRSAQKFIIASLNKQFPNITIIGEEESSDLNISSDLLVTELDEDFLTETCPNNFLHLTDDDFVVWVDPLDGTSEYTQGFLEHVTVLIGIAVKNSAVGGIIHQPYYKNASGDIGRTIWGLKGLGIGGIEAQPPPKDKYIVTTTRSHFNPIIQSALDTIDATEILRVGGAGYKVLQLLDGKANAYIFPSPGCKKWDTCAPEAVLEAHGGILTDIFGEHYEYNKNVPFPNSRGVLATAKGESHSNLVFKIPENVKESMNK